jgi:hypothetical protein
MLTLNIAQLSITFCRLASTQSVIFFAGNNIYLLLCLCGSLVQNLGTYIRIISLASPKYIFTVSSHSGNCVFSSHSKPELKERKQARWWALHMISWECHPRYLNVWDMLINVALFPVKNVAIHQPVRYTSSTAMGVRKAIFFWHLGERNPATSSNI